LQCRGCDGTVAEDVGRCREWSRGPGIGKRILKGMVTRKGVNNGRGGGRSTEWCQGRKVEAKADGTPHFQEKAAKRIREASRYAKYHAAKDTVNHADMSESGSFKGSMGLKGRVVRIMARIVEGDRGVNAHVNRAENDADNGAEIRRQKYLVFQHFHKSSDIVA